jgi:cell wall-associated NlpC family hydrolase
MNKLCVIAVLAGFSISCSTIKTSSSAPVASEQPSVKSKDPVFLDNISIPREYKPENSSKKSTQTEESVSLVSNNSTSAGAGTAAVDQLQFKYSILLNVPVEEIRDEKMYTYIDEWYGTKYRYGGNDKSGIDCSAFTQSFLSNLYGLSIPRTSVDQYINSKRVKKELLECGDLVFFRTTSRKNVSHVGIYLCNNKFLHASTSFGVTISDLSEGYYASRYVGAGRVRKPF